MAEFKFSIPWINDLHYLKKIIDNRECKIYEVFFRPSDFTNIKETKKILNFLKENSISLAMTTTQRSAILDFNKTFEEYLDTFNVIPNRLIVDQFSIDTVAKNKLVIKHNINLYISAIMGIKSDKDIQKLVNLKRKYKNIDAVCLHHDSTKDKKLKNKAQLLQQNGIDSILLVTESCSYNCPFRKDHYSYIATKFKNQKDPYQIWCVKNRLKQSDILQNMAGFIHPNDIPKYHKKYHIKYFKISGQPSCDRQRLVKENIKTINAYLFNKIPKNIFEIIVFTYLKHPFGNFLRLRGNNDNNILRLPFFTKYENKIYNLFLKTIKLNKIYSKYNNNLPWTSISIPKEIKKQLKAIKRSERILVIGCGLGQHLSELQKMGFKDIWATDLSNIAILEVRKKYPFVKSFTCPTEELSKNNLKDFIVLDIHNLHQINPNELKDYLKNLKKISKKIIISWIYEPKKGIEIKSDVKELGNIFMHSIEFVKKILKMKKSYQFDYKELGNQKYFTDNNKHVNHFIGGIFNK